MNNNMYLTFNRGHLIMNIQCQKLRINGGGGGGGGRLGGQYSLTTNFIL